MQSPGGSDYKLIYRHYATLYFVFCVDSSESELGILDLIQVGLLVNWWRTGCYRFSPQVFVETLDKCFENVCELDLIFHMDKVSIIKIVFQSFIDNNVQVHWILNELVMGGMVLETNMTEIMLRIEEQNKIEKEEVRLSNLLIPKIQFKDNTDP